MCAIGEAAKRRRESAGINRQKSTKSTLTTEQFEVIAALEILARIGGRTLVRAVLQRRSFGSEAKASHARRPALQKEFAID